MKSNRFSIVKYYFDNGLWNEKMVKLAVEKEWITEDEFKEIVNPQVETSNVEE